MGPEPHHFLSFRNICATLTKKFWPLLNQPASYGPFWPKLWVPLAFIFVEIFQKEKDSDVVDPLE